LLGFVRQKEHQVVDRVDLFVVFPVLTAVLWQELLAQQAYSGRESLTQILILQCVQHAALDLVDQGSGHGND